MSKTPAQRLAAYQPAGEWAERAVAALTASMRVYPEAWESGGVALKRAINAAYPFGTRKRHPYKVWCAVVREITGIESLHRRRDQDAGAALFLIGRHT